VGPAGTRGGGQLPLPVNDRGRLAYLADRSSREGDFTSLTNLDGHGSVTFDSSRVEPRGPQSVLDVAESKAIKEPEKRGGGVGYWKVVHSLSLRNTR
jgi:hypothetical protein